METSARDPQTAQMANLQRITGLRVSEAATVREQDIDLDANRIHVDGKGGAKGGRDRVVDVSDEHADFLAELKEQAASHADGYVFQGRGKHGQGLGDRTREAVRQACHRIGVAYYGTHGFRKGWAQEKFRTLLAKGLDRREAGWQVSQALGHGRLDVLRHYLPSW
jgi:integrase